MSSYGANDLKPSPKTYRSHEYKVQIIRSLLVEHHTKEEAVKLEEYINEGWEIIHQSTISTNDMPTLITIIKKLYETT